MTRGELIDQLITAIKNQVGPISVIMEPMYGKVTIGDESWEVTEDVVVSVQAYLDGILKGYMLGLQWARNTMKS